MVHKAGTGGTRTPIKNAKKAREQNAMVTVAMTIEEHQALGMILSAADARRDQWAEFAETGEHESIDAYDVLCEMFESGQEERENMVMMIDAAEHHVRTFCKRFEQESTRMHYRFGDRYKRFI